MKDTSAQLNRLAKLQEKFHSLDLKMQKHPTNLTIRADCFDAESKYDDAIENTNFRALAQDYERKEKALEELKSLRLTLDAWVQKIDDITDALGNGTPATPAIGDRCPKCHKKITALVNGECTNCGLQIEPPPISNVTLRDGTEKVETTKNGYFSQTQITLNEQGKQALSTDALGKDTR